MQVGFSTDVFFERLYGSVPSLGIPIGLVPRPYVSVFTGTSNTHELAWGERSKMYMERIPWVDPSGSDKHTYTGTNPLVTFEMADLAKLLFGVYRKMLEFDTMDGSSMQRLGPEQRRIFSSPYYTRESVAFLFAHVKRRAQAVDGNWEAVASALMGPIAEHDRQVALAHHFHDLQDNFRHQRQPFLDSEQGFLEGVLGAELFHGWTDVPRLVCVVLTVPSAGLGAIREDKMEPSPRLICNFGMGSSSVLTLSSIQAVWGKCVPIEGSEGHYAIEEDLEAFWGDSDLVVSFWANAEMMILSGMTISLGIRRTPLALF
ncbi:hypothetical protein BDV93DRAFT_219305 [Ceratobasidium sp. AG-I]|nr:hypothetical protein BDV93DRAFT_219305 [Ceratobasidium sp. AG-I]